METNPTPAPWDITQTISFTGPFAADHDRIVSALWASARGTLFEIRLGHPGVLTGEEVKVARKVRKAIREVGVRTGTVHADAGRVWTIVLAGPRADEGLV